jgi:hypothetical protein
MSDKSLGYCGLYCGGCAIFQKTQSGRHQRDENNNPLICFGCNSDTTTKWCTDCEIKTCNRNKGHRFCYECNDNPCEILNRFINDPKYPYHTEVQENMKLLKEIGLEQWTKENEKKYHCGLCNNQTNWFETRCSACGNEKINKITK